MTWTVWAKLMYDVTVPEDMSSQHRCRDAIRQKVMPLSMINRQVSSCAYDTF